MKQNKGEPHKVATGGKENELKLWDLNRMDVPIFEAQNVNIPNVQCIVSVSKKLSF